MALFGKAKKPGNPGIGTREPVALPPAPATLISAGTKIVGTINSNDQIQVDGEIEGTLQVRNHVIVGKSGVIRADVSVQSVQVFGRIVGDVVSAEKVTIERSGAIEGNIVAPKLAIAEGALFRGNIDMSQRGRKTATDGTGAHVRDEIGLQNAVSNDA